MAEKKSLLNKVIDAVSDRDEKAAAAAAAKAKAQAQVAANARAKAAVVKAKEAKIAVEKEAVAKAVTLKKHVVQQGETWTHLAQKYYGRSIEPFWRLIYEYPANKALVGGDYKKLRAGMEIVIPELTEELKNMPIIKPSK
jgi:nucleoid-associated protein YgaU